MNVLDDIKVFVFAVEAELEAMDHQRMDRYRRCQGAMNLRHS